jgi:hypothetical protein
MSPIKQPSECTKKYFRIDRRQIHFLKFILEGYDGVAVLRTVDPREGLVVLHVSPGCEREVENIMADMKREMRVEAVTSVEQEAP